MKGDGGVGALPVAEDIDDIARRCFEAEARDKPVSGRTVTFLMSLFVLAALLSSLPAPGYPPAFILGSAMLALAALSGHAVGKALGGLARVQIKSLAGEAPLENIEYLADRIIESSDMERRAVEELDRVLRQDAR